MPSSMAIMIFCNGAFGLGDPIPIDFGPGAPFPVRSLRASTYIRTVSETASAETGFSVIAERLQGAERIERMESFMNPALKWIPVAGCAIGVIYLVMALLASHELIQTARGTVALAVSIVPYLSVKILKSALSIKE